MCEITVRVTAFSSTFVTTADQPPSTASTPTPTPTIVPFPNVGLLQSVWGTKDSDNIHLEHNGGEKKEVILLNSTK